MAHGLNGLDVNFSHIHILVTYTIEMLCHSKILNVYPNHLKCITNGHQLWKMYSGNGGILVRMNKGWHQSCISPKGGLYVLIVITICQLPLMCLFVPSPCQCCLPIALYLSWLSLHNYLFSLSCQHLCHFDTQSQWHNIGQHVLLSFVNKAMSPLENDLQIHFFIPNQISSFHKSIPVHLSSKYPKISTYISFHLNQNISLRAIDWNLMTSHQGHWKITLFKNAMLGLYM